MSSSCSDSIDKKLEEGGPPLATLQPVNSVLPTLDEKDEDEAAKVVGFERNEYTEEEARAVRRKVDRRVSDLTFAACTRLPPFLRSEADFLSGLLGARRSFLSSLL